MLVDVAVDVAAANKLFVPAVTADNTTTYEDPDVKPANVTEIGEADTVPLFDPTTTVGVAANATNHEITPVPLPTVYAQLNTELVLIVADVIDNVGAVPCEIV